MNKEELLNELKNLKAHLPQNGVDDATIDAQVAELEKIAEDRVRISAEINELEAKLSSDSNYPNNTLLYNEGIRFNIEDSINAANATLLENKSRIAVLNGEIESYQHELNNINPRIDRKERQILEVGRRMRSIATPTAEQDADFHRQLAVLRDELTTLRNRDTELNNLIAEKNSNLRSFQALTPDLESQVSIHQQELNDFDAKDKKETNVDVVAKEADQNKLDQLRATLSSYNMRDSFLDYNYSTRINDLINAVENDRLTPEQALNEITSLRNYIQSEYVDKDRNQRIAEESRLEDADRAMSLEIASLENKLSDEQNYTPSIFAAEKNNDQLTLVLASANSAAATIAQVDAEIAGFSRDLLRIDRELSNSNEYISGLQQEMAEYGVELRRLKSPNEDDAVKSYVSLISANREEIAKEQINISNLLREQETIRNQVSSAEQRKLISKNKQERYLSLADSLKASLNDRNNVDKHAMRLDQDRLSQLQSSRESIKNRIEFINYDAVTEMDNMISALGNTKKLVVPETERATSFESPVIPTAGSVQDKVSVEDEPFESLFASLNGDNQPVESTDIVSPADTVKQEYVDESPIKNDDAVSPIPFKFGDDQHIEIAKGEKTNLDGQVLFGNVVDKDGRVVANLVQNEDNSQYFTSTQDGKKSTALVPYEGPVEVVDFSQPNPELSENASKKKLLDKLKDWLNNLKTDWKKNWKKYVVVTALAIAAGISLKACNVTGLTKPTDENTTSISQDLEEQVATSETALEDELSKEDEDLVTGKNDKEVSSKTSNSNKSNSKSNNYYGGSYSGTGDISVSPVVPPADTVGEVIEESTEVVEDNVVTAPDNVVNPEPTHETTPVPDAGGGHEPGYEETTETGGEQIGDTTEVVDDVIVNPDDVTPTPAPGNTNSTPTPEDGEVVDDNVVMPDIGGGEIVSDDVTVEVVEPTETPEPIVEPIIPEETPAPVVEETPTPVVEETPTPVVEETPAPVVEETPAPVVEETPAPVVEETPTLTPAPVVEDPESYTVSLNEGETYNVDTTDGSLSVESNGSMEGNADVVTGLELNDNGGVDVSIDATAPVESTSVESTEEAETDISALLGELGINQDEQTLGGK